jgi:hypothetical protein
MDDESMQPEAPETAPSLVPNTRAAMADYLRGIALWRRRKAEEYDRDVRNLRTADALEELAEFVLALPDDDERLLTLGRLAMDGEFFAPGQQTHYEIGRLRFHNPDVGLDPFLSRIVELAIADAGEHGRFGGRMPEGDDPWG